MTLVNFYITGINLQNKQCFISLLEIVEPEKIRGIKAKIKEYLPPQMLKFYDFPPNAEVIGRRYDIFTTTEEYKAKKLEVGQVVKLDIPSKIADIVTNDV